VVLFLGKITPRKGRLPGEGLRPAGGKDAFLVIAGNDMGFKGRVEEIIKECGVGERVLFTGLVTERKNSPPTGTPTCSSTRR
jgi:hypothetical protein